MTGMGQRRTVVVTGGSSGIGLAAAVALARAGDDVVLLGRQPARLAHAADRVAAVAGRPPRTYRADFARLAEVREVADRLRADLPRIDVLVNNAGQLAARTRATVDGHDVTMQVNHLGGFLLTHLLLDRLRAAAGPARVVTTGSLAEAWGWLDVDRPAAPAPRYRARWLAYGASKQANLLFTVEAARRFAPLGVVPTCFFPGLVRTRFGRGSPLFTLARPVPLLFRTAEQGADTLVWLATADDALVPGGYFAFRAPFAASPRSTDPDRARRLWTASLRAVGLPVTAGTA
ncbi:SDR family NAD(P)-dependent oxidoreductase [Polymorphospora sp. NPDC050346]|uniref:SDR family NAD(P)-dependent oxidoreductase n=1 Tax=Polymorphospora sp. NPDC050346 TaxID=3155780 RepID=UPI0033CD5DA3